MEKCQSTHHRTHTLSLLGIACIFLITCNEKEHPLPFDKSAFLKECGISIEDLQLSPSVEDSLIEESLEYLSDTPYYPLLNSYKISKTDSIAKAICILNDSLRRVYISLDYNMEKKYMPSVLLDHFYVKAISSEEEPIDLIELTLSYAGKHERNIYDRISYRLDWSNDDARSTGIVSRTCYKWAKNINDTLALICLCHTILSDSTEQAYKRQLEYYSTGLNLSNKIKIRWPYDIYRVYDVVSDTINNYCRQDLIVDCAYYSLKIGEKSDYYADLLFQAIKCYPDEDSSVRQMGLLFVDVEKSPLFQRYKSLITKNRYSDAKELLDTILLIRRTTDNYSSEDPFSFLPPKPLPADSSDYGQYYNFFSIKERAGIVTFENARLFFLQKDPHYSSWLTQGFQECVWSMFPTGYAFRLSDYLKPEHKNYSSIPSIIPLQYNNNNSCDVVNAALFIKGTSDIIYRTLHSFLNNTKELGLTDYVQSVREGREPKRWSVILGDSVEDEKTADMMSEKIRLLIGDDLKVVFSECLYSYQDIISNLQESECAIEVLRVPPLDPDKDFEYKMAIMKPEEKMPIIIDLCSEEELMKQIKRQRGHYYDRRNHKLYNLLWKPIEPYVSDSRRIFIAMDGQTQLLNIKYLTGRDGKRIADKHEIYQLTSTKEIIRLHKEETNKPMSSIALFGGLDYDMDIESDKKQANLLAYRGVDSTIFRGSLDILPESKKEVVSIDSMAKRYGLDSSLFVSLDGTEEAMKSLPHHPVSILHVATHGFYFTKKEWDKGDTFFEVASKATDPLKRCGLLLSGGQNAWLGREIPKDREDGILTGYEISCMDLSSVDLVVLSACNTALGEISSQGVSGLQQAFKRAGVQTMIMALEPVRDDATQVLMTTFYSLLLSGMEKHEAFNTSINEMRESARYSNPSCWAPFIMVD